MRRSKLVTTLAACVLPLAAASPAAADSIVFIKEADVWVANPDGSGARAVTTDGTADSPYWSPSQADDGTIAAARRQGVQLLHRDGTKLAELDPPPLTDSVSHPVDGPVADVAISPDAKTIAFVYAQYSCPVGAECGGRQTMGYMPTSGTRPPGEYGGGIYIGNPSWMSNTRTLAFGGYNHQVNTHDLGPGSTDVHWFDDWEVVGQENATDLDDGELNRQGNKLVAIRGYGSTTHVVWYSTSGPPATPQMVCATGQLDGLHGPSWAPDGDRMAWGEPDGVWTIASTATDESRCADVQPKLTIPGGSEPDWGPADVGAPKPPAADEPAAPAAPAGPAPASPSPQPGGDDVQRLVTVDLAKRLRIRGFIATVGVSAPGRLSAVVKVRRKVVLKGSATAAEAGAVKLRLKRTRAGRRLRRKVTGKLTVTFTPTGGARQSLKRTVRLVR